MEMNKYQSLAEGTAIYPREFRVIYPALGLVGEAGEVANKVKKLIRDNPDQASTSIPTKQRYEIADEVGDVLWYVAQLLNDLDILLEGIAIENIDKLTKRKEEGKLKGSGDKR